MKNLSDQRKRARRVLAAWRKAYPNARCELDFSTPLELAIAAILSAQCTDKRVNLVTPALFRKYRTAEDWANAPQSILEQEIRSTGFFRNKARNIRGLAQALIERHDGRIPNDFDALVKLPGIGRKTANVLMITVFDAPGIVVDTHATRISNRLGFTSEKDPVKIEFDLQKIVPRKDWGVWSHGMVFHGRYCCLARNPQCNTCPVNKLCPSRGMFARAGKR